MIDLKLDTIDHDLDLSSFGLELISDLDRLEQKIKIVLLFFFAEWFLDTTVGIKYHEIIFVANPNLTLIDSLFKTAILEINEVQELLAYDSNFDSTNRSFSLTFTVQSNIGQLTTSQGIIL